MIGFSSLVPFVETYAAVALVAAAVLYATVMVAYFRDKRGDFFTTYLFEGVTIGASVILLLSLFNA